MRAFFTLFLVTAVATATALEPPKSYIEAEPHLRGANTEDRDLLTAGGSSTSLSFSIASAHGSDQFCFDYRRTCLEYGRFYTDADTYTDTEGNAIAFALTEECLWLEATCHAWANAYAQACAFAKVDGKIDIDISTSNSKKTVGMSVNVHTAATTFAMATSEAVAKAYTDVDAQSYTSVGAFCTAVKHMSPLCEGGTAETDLEQFAIANATSFGKALSVAASGGAAGSSAEITAQGTSLDYVNGVVSAYATAWAFASASAAAEAFAKAITAASNDSFTAICITKHKEVCGISENNDRGICSYPSADAACAAAFATGEVFAKALAKACAEACVAAIAIASTDLTLSANVNCKSTPIMTWKCTKADVGQSCSV